MGRFDAAAPGASPLLSAEPVDQPHASPDVSPPAPPPPVQLAEADVNMRGVPVPGAGPTDPGIYARDRLRDAGVDFSQGVLPTRGVPPKRPTAAFSGSGATGIDIKEGRIPLGDQLKLGRYALAQRAARSSAAEAKRAEELVDHLNKRSESLPAVIRDSGDAMGERLDAVGFGVAADAVRRTADLGSRIVGGGTKAAGELAYEEWQERDQQAKMRKQEAQRLRQPIQKYENPITGNFQAHYPGAKVSRAEAETMLNLPINTVHADVYGAQVPTRAHVIKAAADRYRLDPNMLAGFLLAEQRDQSRNEDIKDYQAAIGPMKANTSIGLGQMTVRTALNNNADMLRDLVDPRTRARLSHSDAARLLTSDEHAIFASARYVRSLADGAAKLDPTDIPKTLETFPRLMQGGLQGPHFNDDQIRAFGSEYTSRPWDDKLYAWWGDVVVDATNDVRRTGIFNPPMGP